MSNPLNNILEGKEFKNYDLCLKGLRDSLSEGPGDEVYDALTEALTGHISGHVDRHSPEDNAKIIKAVNTVIVDNKCQSFFNDKEESRDFIMNVIDYKAESIAAWLTGDRASGYGPDATNPLRMVLTVDMGEPVGWGINPQLKEVTTNVVTLILDRESNDSINVGFSVKTAYPNITGDYGWETGKIFDINTIRELDSEVSLSPPVCMYIVLKNTQEANERIEYCKATRSDQEDRVKLSKMTRQDVYTIYIKDEKDFILTKDHDGHKPTLNEFYLEDKYKDISRRLQHAQRVVSYASHIQTQRTVNSPTLE